MILPGGFGTLDEFTAVITLLKTGKPRRISVILVGTTFWQGLLAWMRDQMAGQGLIGPQDLDLVQLIDEPAHVVEAIFAFYEARDIVPAETEQPQRSFL